MNFVRKDYPTVTSGWFVRYRLDSDRFDGEVNASREGVSLQGTWPAIADPVDIETLIATIRRARIHHEHLAEENRSGLFYHPHVKPLPEEAVDKLLEVEDKDRGQIRLPATVSQEALLWDGPGTYTFDPRNQIWVRKPD